MQSVNRHMEAVKNYLTGKNFKYVEEMLEALFIRNADDVSIRAEFKGIHQVYITAKNSERVQILRAIIQALNELYPERRNSVAALPDVSHLTGMQKLRELCVQYFTLIQPGTTEQKLILLEVFVAKQQLNLPLRYNGKLFTDDFETLNVFDDGSPPVSIPLKFVPPARLYRCDFSYVDLSALLVKRPCNDATFREPQFQHSNLLGTTFENVRIVDMDVQGATLTGLNTAKAQIHFRPISQTADETQELRATL